MVEKQVEDFMNINEELSIARQNANLRISV